MRSGRNALAGAIAMVAVAALGGLSTRAAAVPSATADRTGALDVSAFAAECAAVEADLRADASGRYTRAELLVMLGRSSAAMGRARVAAAAYLTFLNEFGLQHEWSDRVVLRLVDSLAPLDPQRCGIGRTARGPEFVAVWKGDVAADRAQVRQAIQVCEYACAGAGDPRTKAEALLRAGWLHRLLSEWGASTQAWDRCAEAASGTPLAAQARRLAAECS